MFDFSRRKINGFNAIEHGQNKWYTSIILEKNGICHPEKVCSYTVRLSFAQSNYNIV